MLEQHTKRPTFFKMSCLLALPLSSLSYADDSFEVYGFAQLDYIQDFGRSSPVWEATLRPSRLPTVDGQYGADGQAVFSVRQSRFGTRTRNIVQDSELKTQFEFDMYGVGDDEGQTTMRLRHAYGEWNGFLAGQTNSLFMDGDVFPNTIDYWGPSGMVFLRNPQIRWTPVQGDTSFAVAIEKPGSDVDSGELGGALQGNQPLPDFTAQFRSQGDWGHYQVAGILRQIAYETIGNSDAEPSGEELGWGIDLTSNIRFGSDRLILSLVYGEGIASYMNDGGMDMAPDELNVNSLTPVPLTGVVVYYDHSWSETLTSSIGYSYTEVDNQDAQTGDAFNKGEYASVNLLSTPADNILLGVEYLWGQRTDNDGSSGDDSRLQFTFKYSFSSGNLAL